MVSRGLILALHDRRMQRQSVHQRSKFLACCRMYLWIPFTYVHYILKSLEFSIEQFSIGVSQGDFACIESCLISLSPYAEVSIQMSIWDDPKALSFPCESLHREMLPSLIWISFVESMQLSCEPSKRGHWAVTKKRANSWYIPHGGQVHLSTFLAWMRMECAIATYYTEKRHTEILCLHGV